MAEEKKGSGIGNVILIVLSLAVFAGGVYFLFNAITGESESMTKDLGAKIDNANQKLVSIDASVNRLNRIVKEIQTKLETPPPPPPAPVVDPAAPAPDAAAAPAVDPKAEDKKAP